MSDLLQNLDKLHITTSGIERIKRNLGLQECDIVLWCKEAIVNSSEIIRKGKNWYVYTYDAVITINARSYTIITAHKLTAATRLIKNIMKPKEILFKWIEAFNNADVEAISNLYDDNAINHQVAKAPVKGKMAIKEMFDSEFAAAKMVCIAENIFEDGDWAMLEWRDPLGLRGCGFFQIKNNKIVFQRGYWDKLTFLKQHNLPIE